MRSQDPRTEELGTQGLLYPTLVPGLAVDAVGLQGHNYQVGKPLSLRPPKATQITWTEPHTASIMGWQGQPVSGSE